MTVTPLVHVTDHLQRLLKPGVHVLYVDPEGLLKLHYQIGPVTDADVTAESLYGPNVNKVLEIAQEALK